MKFKTERYVLAAMLIGGAYLMGGHHVIAQDARWASKNFAALQRLIDERTALSAVLESGIVTELPNQDLGSIIIQISRDAPLGENPTISKGSRAICHYQPVRSANRIPATCERLLMPYGTEFRIKATVYGRDGLPGIPADGIESSGALRAYHGKRVLLYLNEVISIGVTGGPHWVLE